MLFGYPDYVEYYLYIKIKIKCINNLNRVSFIMKNFINTYHIVKYKTKPNK